MISCLRFLCKYDLPDHSKGQMGLNNGFVKCKRTCPTRTGQTRLDLSGRNFYYMLKQVIGEDNVANAWDFPFTNYIDIEDIICVYLVLLFILAVVQALVCYVLRDMINTFYFQVFLHHGCHQLCCNNFWAFGILYLWIYLFIKRMNSKLT